MAALLLPGLASTGSAEFFSDKTFILARPGQRTPDGLDVLEFPGAFALSNQGALFRSRLQDSEVMATYAARITGIKEVMRTGTVIPGRGTIMSVLDKVHTNHSLETTEFVRLKGLDGVERDAVVAGSSPASLRVVAEVGTTLTDKGYTLRSTYARGINDQGQVAIQGLSAGWGAYIGNPDGSLVEVAKSGQPAPETEYLFTGVNGMMYNHGQMLIGGTINNGDPLDDSAVYRRSTAGNLIKIAASLESAPRTSRSFGWIMPCDMNDNGEVVFYGYLNDSAGNHQGAGLFKGRDAASVRPIAYSGQPAPAGLGIFTAFDNSVGINAAGKASFVGYYEGGSALFIGDGDSQRLLLKTGDRAPGGATFTGFSMSRISDSGTVMFAAKLNGNSAPQGLYLTDGKDIIKVAQAGDTVEGKALTQIRVDPQAYNSFQQVVYQTKLSGDPGHSILVFAPRLRWRDLVGGAWADYGRWTASLTPAEYNHVDIIPEVGFPVHGPVSRTEIASLRIGAAVSGVTDFKLSTGAIVAKSGVHIVSGGRLSGSGDIAGDVTNTSFVAPGNSPGVIRIEGNYRQENSGVLNIEIAGKEEDQFDHILVDGDVSLAGGLEIDLLDGAIDRIARGDRFVFLGSTGALSGAFAASTSGSRIPTKDGLASFEVSYAGGQATLSNFEPADTDGDGVPDYWMQKHFTSPTAPAGHADEDSDGDGVSNRDEYIAGTGPKDGSSALRATVSVSQGSLAKDISGISVTFQTTPGRSYAVQHSADLTADSWENVKTGIAGDGSVKTEVISTDASLQACGYYRVVVSR